ncbi:hypothetical protein V3C99_018351 [Haemonchus contortus]
MAQIGKRDRLLRAAPLSRISSRCRSRVFIVDSWNRRTLCICPLSADHKQKSLEQVDKDLQKEEFTTKNRVSKIPS